MFGFTKKPEMVLWEAVLAGDVSRVRELLQGQPELATVRVPQKLCRREQGLVHDATLLHVAAARGLAGVVKLLLVAGTDVNATAGDGETALHEAAACGHVEVVDLLLYREAELDARDGRGRTALHVAGFAGQEKVVKLLLSRGASQSAVDDEGNTVLHCVAAGGCEEGVRRLLQGGAPVDACNETKRRTPLHLVVVHADHSAYSRVEPGRRSERARMERVAEILIEYGADVNAVDEGDNTPLDLFNFMQGDDETDPLVKLLQKHGGRWMRYRHRHAQSGAQAGTATVGAGSGGIGGSGGGGRAERSGMGISLDDHSGDGSQESHGSTMGGHAGRSVHGFVGEPYTLGEGPVLIGRHEECDVRFKSRTLSRRHAQITLEHGGYMIRDMGSHNGVKINGHRVHTAHLLSPGETITLGVYDFSFDGENLIPLREELSEDELRAEGRKKAGGPK